MPVTFVGSSSSGQRVVESGSLVTPIGSTEFEISFHDLSFRFILAEGSTPRVHAKEGGKTRLLITFEGFVNALPTVWQSEVGTLGSEPLWACIAVTAVGEAERQQRIINYTFYAGRPA